MTDIKCVDSSTWLAYALASSKQAKTIIEGDGLLVTSVLSIFEVRKRLIQLKRDPEAFIKFVYERSKVLVLTADIAEEAANLSFEKNLAAMDALIYATSQSCSAQLVTADNDFRGLSNVMIIS